jgi:hypothetical protein
MKEILKIENHLICPDDLCTHFRTLGLWASHGTMPGLDFLFSTQEWRVEVNQWFLHFWVSYGEVNMEINVGLSFFILSNKHKKLSNEMVISLEETYQDTKIRV